ncbi:ABC transporter ATP-binding protein [Streptomyces physcomitrii]|uniref:ABC transporter ATP-binding protein n=1 Tax=Streptomyces physcomitrii TaxID=2724184 RepID=A0ABX1H7X0_9ACTN|nr:ABC transporter ATP-binding protein [Streptomyces physcomitrii]NKI44148.1 ABC transporter ATP-binding protein [Streptomyces physcomitrii]
MNRLSVLAELFREGWRSRRALVLAYLGVTALDIAAVAGFALALRSFVHQALAHHYPGAVPGALVAAVCWSLSTAGVSARTNLVYLLAESTGLELNSRVLALVAGLEDLARLEQPEYADHVDLVRGGGDVIARSAWLSVEVLSALTRLTAVLVVMAFIAPPLLAVAAGLVPALLLSRRGQHHIRGALKRTAPHARLAEHLHHLLTEPAPGMEIRIAGAHETLRARAHGAWTALLTGQERAQWRAAGLSVTGWAVFAAGNTLALLLLVRSVGAGDLAPADVLVLLTLTTTLRTQAEGTMATLRQAADGVHLLESYCYLTRVGSGRPPGSGGTRLPPPSALREGIALRGLSFGYPGSKAPVLRDIDLLLPAGATVALVGEHGAGKTSLVKLLCGLYEPTGGSILVDAVPLGRIPAPAWWAKITAGFQDHARFAFLAREAVGAGELSALDDRERITEALTAGGAREFVSALPAGLETQLGSEFGGEELSGGQWQRLALSRAGMRRAPLLCVLDEPTASLDARSEYELHRRQARLARVTGARHGTVTLMVTHRFSTVRMADLIVVLSRGSIVEQGSHADLMAKDGSYASMYRMQEAGYREKGGR